MVAYYNDIRKVRDLHLPWEILTDISIPTVGVSGLTGRVLVNTLIQLPDKTFRLYAGVWDLVYVQSYFMRYKDDESFTLIQCGATASIPLDINFHYIVYIVSRVGPAAFHSDPVGATKANTLRVNNLFSYEKQHNLRRLLYVFSGEVYGKGNGIPFREEDNGSLDQAPLCACYPTAKRIAGTLCIAYAAQSQIETVIACPCHICEPFYTSKNDRAYMQFIRNVLADKNIILRSSGLQQRPWCYVVDCMFALLYVLLEGKARNTHNIADARLNVNICEFARVIAPKSE